MKRTRIVGLCVMAALAAFALSAMAASSASAGTYKDCVAQKKGKYANSTCTTLDEKKGKPKGKYELGVVSACVAQKKGKYANATCTTLDEKKGKPKGKYEKATKRGFTSVTGEAKLETPSLGGTVTCTSSAGAGEIINGKEAPFQTTFKGCETKGEPCESSGNPAGSITTFPLETILIDHGEKGPGGKEPLAGEVWTEFRGEAAYGGVQAVFGCTEIGYFETTGTLSGVNGGVNTLSFTGTVNFANGLGEQELVTAVSANPTFPPSETLGPFASTEVTKGTVTFEKEVDVAS